MAQLILNFLFLLAACLPALLYLLPQQKRVAWLLPLCAFVCAAFPPSALLFLIYTVMLGVYLWFFVYKPLESGKLLSFFLSWGGCITVINTGHFLHSGTSASVMSWLLLVLSYCVSFAFGYAIRWFSRWKFVDSVPLSEERKISPLPLLTILLALLLLMTLIGGLFPLGCAFCAAILEIIALLITALWNDMSLVVRRSKETSENNRQSRQAIDRASRSSEAELQRQLTECRNILLQVSVAYQNNDSDALSSLLQTPEVQENVSYCSFSLLDAILRHGAYAARKAGMAPNFQLWLGSLQGYSVSDIGVIIDLMLGLVIEKHPGEPDTLRLRAQEWGNALIITAGRRDCLRIVHEDKMNALRQLTAERGGWMEFSEKENGICLSAVIFRSATDE